LIIDQFDSFTYNLYHYIQPGVEKIEVVRYDQFDPGMENGFDGVVLSPGPGLPSDYPLVKDVILGYGKSHPVLGICLGHQAIAEAFGGMLFNMNEVWHGISRKTIHTGKSILFQDIDTVFFSGRYHSWAVDEASLPACLTITARDDNGTIMALEHDSYPVAGIQFHPESVLTPAGKIIIHNWLNNIS
jgi:anthranilate synthase component II